MEDKWGSAEDMKQALTDLLEIRMGDSRLCMPGFALAHACPLPRKRNCPIQA